MDAILQAFVDDYRARDVPPPHILLVGKDEDRNLAIAREFAGKLAADIYAVDAGDVKLIGDLTALLTVKKVTILSNVQKLRMAMRDGLAHDLEAGEIQITIGTGPAARVHVMQVQVVALLGTCPAKNEIPATLLNQFRCVIPVEPYTSAELLALLEDEAAKDRISFDSGAGELIVRCSNGRSGILLNRFRRIVPLIDQVQRTNHPCLTVEEISTALARLRIEIPKVAPAANQRDLDSLSGQDFEALVKVLLVEMGFQAELTDVTGDGGIDIIATLDRPFVGGRYIFQCKRYAEDNLVGAPAIRDFYGAVMADRAIKGIFITTSDFTAQAKEFADQTRIESVNRVKLLQLLEEYQVSAR